MRIAIRSMVALVVTSLFLMVVALSGPALAGDGPSPENCRDKGLLDIDCYVCDSGRYLGKVTVQAEYNPERDNCFGNLAEAILKCEVLYDAGGGEMAVKGSYFMGFWFRQGWMPAHCKH